jgi:hypothetical protein
LPRNVIVADSVVAIVRAYREYAATQFVAHGDRKLGSAGFGVSQPYSEPVLALFPRIAADPAMMQALRHQYTVELRRRKQSTARAAASAVLGTSEQAKETARQASMLAFRDAVLRVWPALAHADVAGSRSRFRYESFEDREKRTARIRQIVSSTDSFRREESSSSRSLGANVNGSSGGDVYTAFTVRDVVFDVQ